MVTRVENEDVIALLNWRYAVKKFDSKKKISDLDWAVLEESLRLSASSSGLQPWKFIIVKNPDVRKKLTPVSYGQTKVEEASHLVVFCHAKKITEDYIDRYVQQVAKIRSQTIDSLKDYRDSMVRSVVKGPLNQNIESWTARQTYIALGTLLTTAAMMGIDACPMEGFLPEQYDEILGLKESNYKSVAIVTLGYRSVNDSYQSAKKVRFDKDDVITVI